MYFAPHQAIAEFRLHKPTSVEDAVAQKAQAGPDAAWLAGGVDLIPDLRRGRAVHDVVWLGNIAGFQDVSVEPDWLRIGAGAPYGILGSAAVAAEQPDLAAAWASVANVRVQESGTLGGNIMSANSGYDALPALMALEAQLEFCVLRNGAPEREMRPAAPALIDDSLLTAICLPRNRQTLFSMDRSLKPVISAAVGLRKTANGWRARTAYGCAWSAPVAITLEGNETNGVDDLEYKIASALGTVAPPTDDHIASGDYRRRMASVLAARQIRNLRV